MKTYILCALLSVACFASFAQADIDSITALTTAIDSNEQAELQAAEPVAFAFDLKGVTSSWNPIAGEDHYLRIPISLKRTGPLKAAKTITVDCSLELHSAGAECWNSAKSGILLSPSLTFSFPADDNLLGTAAADIVLYLGEEFSCTSMALLSLKLSANGSSNPEAKTVVIEAKQAAQKKEWDSSEEKRYDYHFHLDDVRLSVVMVESEEKQTLAVTRLTVAEAMESQVSTVTQGVTSTPSTPSTPRNSALRERLGRAANEAEASEGATNASSSSSADIQLAGLESEALFRLAFREAVGGVKTLNASEKEEVDIHADAFRATILSSKQSEATAALKTEFEKGLKTAQKEIENEKTLPAGRLELTGSRVELLGPSGREVIGHFEVDSVMINIRNSVIDQMNVYGIATIDSGAQKVKVNAHFYNNVFGISLKQILKCQGTIAEVVDVDDKKLSFRIRPCDVVKYVNHQSFPLSQRVRDASFILHKKHTEQVLQRHKLTDYLSAALYGDVFGLQGDQPNSLILTDIAVNYPLNHHNKGVLTIVPSIDVIFNLARLANQEQELPTRIGDANGDIPGGLRQYINIFDYLQYYSFHSYAGVNLVRAEIKALESYAELFGGFSVYRTKVGVMDNQTAEVRIENITSPAWTVGARFHSSFLDNKMGLRIDGRAMFLTPPIHSDFGYTLDRTNLGNDTIQVNLSSVYWLFRYEVHGFYRRDNGGHYFAKLRWFDSLDNRDVFTQFLVGYSVPLSAIKL